MLVVLADVCSTASAADILLYSRVTIHHWKLRSGEQVSAPARSLRGEGATELFLRIVDQFLWRLVHGIRGQRR